MKSLPSHVDVLVIGAGPNGVSAYRGVKSTLPHLNVLLVDKGFPFQNLRDMPNAQWHSPMRSLKLGFSLDNSIPDDYVPTTSEYVDYCKLCFAEIDPIFISGVQVTKLEFLCQKKLVQVEALYENEIHIIESRYIILASGIYGNKVKPKFDLGQHKISYSYDFGYSNKNLVVVGAGPSAVDAIISLLPFNIIHWVYRSKSPKPVYRTLLPSFNELCYRFKTNLIHYPSSYIIEYDELLSKVQLSTGSSIDAVDNVIVMSGFNSCSDVILNSSIKLESDCVIQSDFHETSVPNVFVFGSISARWDAVSLMKEDTFVSNGNLSKLSLILNTIVTRELSSIFNLSLDVPVNVDSSNPSLLTKLKNRIKKFILS